MTASRRLTRRLFLADLGRGAFAIAVLGVAGCRSTDQFTSQPSASAGASAWRRMPFVGPDVAPFVAAYLRVLAGEVVIVDTGISPGLPGTLASVDVIDAALRAAGRGWADVAHVILTHYHLDHVGGVAEISALAPDARVYAGVADIPRISIATGSRPLVPVGDGDRVSGLRIVATPGHTPGHIAVLDEGGKVLVAGDALTTDGGRPTAPSGWSSEDLGEAMRSVAKLAALDFETLFVGHGDPIGSGAAASVRAFLDRCPLDRLTAPDSTSCWNPTFGASAPPPVESSPFQVPASP